MKAPILEIFFVDVTIIDILDIIIIAYILYKLYFFLRGSRAAQMAMGLMAILFLSLLAQLFNMTAMSWLFQNLRTVWLITFVILFQPEIRRMLTNLGKSRLLRFVIKATEEKVIDEVVQAASSLVKQRHGALMVLIRNTGLKNVIDTGMRLQAEVSSPLLMSIFNPRSPLHDGAVIIQDQVVEAAKCILPLSQDARFDKTLGTRHRAALGLSEESDAFVVVISEERGKISVASHGRLTRDVSEEDLRSLLHEALNVSKAGDSVKRTPSPTLTPSSNPT